ncbi:hypothetical protein V1477_012444 [Vespula maculifrons]|uniref:Uncharacterized protein n=1 Tax=Vespula maculifrons TaxID=7453 RepID=A0ABD2BXI9_VESMC
MASVITNAIVAKFVRRMAPMVTLRQTPYPCTVQVGTRLVYWTSLGAATAAAAATVAAAVAETATTAVVYSIDDNDDDNDDNNNNNNNKNKNNDNESDEDVEREIYVANNERVRERPNDDDDDDDDDNDDGNDDDDDDDDDDDGGGGRIDQEFMCALSKNVCRATCCILRPLVVLCIALKVGRSFSTNAKTSTLVIARPS